MRTSSVESIATSTLDTRCIAPGERDPLILSTFHRLRVGESMLLVCDHEPRRLFSQLRAELPSGFTWICTDCACPRMKLSTASRIGSSAAVWWPGVGALAEALRRWAHWPQGRAG